MISRSFLSSLAALALLAGTSLAHAAIVPVSPGTLTLTNAIAAANNGDVLELADGVYSEGAMLINKPLTIQAASGANPQINIESANITPGAGAVLIDMLEVVTWDGVDIHLGGNDPAGATTRGIVVRGAATTLPNVATFKNLSLTDDANGPDPGNFVMEIDTNAIIDNVNMLINDTQPQGGICVITGENLILTNSTIDVTCSVPLSPVGAVFMQTTTSNLTVDRCKIYARVAGAINLDLTTGTNKTASITNSLLLYNAATQPRAAVLAQRGGDITVQHVTFTDINSTSNTRPLRVNDRQAFGATGSLTVQNCLFNVPTNPAAAVQAYVWTDSNLAPNFTYTIGKNIVRKDPALNITPAAERIGLGTTLIGDANLTDDIHLGDPSPAAGVGEEIGIATDIEGFSRPNPIGSFPDLGASESVLVPVEISNFTLD